MSPDPAAGSAPAGEHDTGAQVPVDPAAADGPADGNGPADGDAPTPRRKHRRAVGGTVPPTPEPDAGPRRSDDLDIAWGDQPSGSDDERFLREVPPHW